MTREDIQKVINKGGWVIRLNIKHQDMVRPLGWYTDLDGVVECSERLYLDGHPANGFRVLVLEESLTREATEDEIKKYVK